MRFKYIPFPRRIWWRMDMEGIRMAISQGRTLDEIAERLDWREFERLCSAILKEHGWKTKNNFRFKTKARHEIDIVAIKTEMVLLVDCKHWGTRQGKRPQIRAAAGKQVARLEEFNKVKFLWRKEKQKPYPLIITLFDEDIIREGEVLVVPVFKLNSFLMEIENYL